MTLISVYNSSGCVGRCDAKCYNATHPDCDCICGGKNHGAGLSQAVGNTKVSAEKWIKRYCKEKGIKGGVGEVNSDIFQMTLFD